MGIDQIESERERDNNLSVDDLQSESRVLLTGRPNATFKFHFIETLGNGSRFEATALFVMTMMMMLFLTHCVDL